MPGGKNGQNPAKTSPNNNKLKATVHISNPAETSPGNQPTTQKNTTSPTSSKNCKIKRLNDQKSHPKSENGPKRRSVFRMASMPHPHVTPVCHHGALSFRGRDGGRHLPAAPLQQREVPPPPSSSSNDHPPRRPRQSADGGGFLDGGGTQESCRERTSQEVLNIGGADAETTRNPIIGPQLPNMLKIDPNTVPSCFQNVGSVPKSAPAHLLV